MGDYFKVNKESSSKQKQPQEEKGEEAANLTQQLSTRSSSKNNSVISQIKKYSKRDLSRLSTVPIFYVAECVKQCQDGCGELLMEGRN